VTRTTPPSYLLVVLIAALCCLGMKRVSALAQQADTRSSSRLRPLVRGPHPWMRRPDPSLYPDDVFPAVILVPGGINPGRMDVYGQDARLLAEQGVVVACFNAEGRVDTLASDDLRSEGDEDFNGFRHQDVLTNIVMGFDHVDADNVGIKSQSSGITMAADQVHRRW
jgi:hypothetical protein